MNNNNDYVYIMIPVKAEMVKNLPLPFLGATPPEVPLAEDESFMPLWYGNSRFPEDDDY
ncbi:MAG: hypothetical protein IJ297_06460 [Clostridia bacterium]|nr:hypothetical protein [Clostridia bacterium]